jgi:uncharacterized protein YbjT (DUF2867 family)
MILVIGASGMLGSRVAGELLARGANVRAAGRKPARLGELAARGAETVALDLTRPETFASALAGVEAVFTAAHGLMDRRRDGTARVDVEGMRRLIDAAEGADVRRFVHTSAQNASTDSLVAFTRAKAAAERHLQASRLDWTILRPSAFAELYAHELIGRHVLAGRTAWLLGSGDTRRNLVAVDDVALITVRALLEGRFSRELVEVAGPDNLTEREVAALYGRLSGKRVRVRCLPPALLRAIARVAGPFHGGVRNLLTFITDLEGRPDLVANASGMAERLGRPPIDMAAFVRAHVG